MNRYIRVTEYLTILTFRSIPSNVSEQLEGPTGQWEVKLWTSLSPEYRNSSKVTT